MTGIRMNFHASLRNPSIASQTNQRKPHNKKRANRHQPIGS